MFLLFLHPTPKHVLLTTETKYPAVDIWSTPSKAIPMQVSAPSQLRLGLISLQRQASVQQQHRTTEVQKLCSKLRISYMLLLK